MKGKVDLKSLVIGILFGLILVLVLGAGRGGIYQCTIANEVGTQQYLFAVLNTQNGSARITQLSTRPGRLAIKSRVLDTKGNEK